MKSKLIPTPPANHVEQPLTFPCLVEQSTNEVVDFIWMATSPKEGFLLYHGGTGMGLHSKQGLPWSQWIKVMERNIGVKRRVIPAGEAVTIQFNA